jgi:hypothetical protein
MGRGEALQSTDSLLKGDYNGAMEVHEKRRVNPTSPDHLFNATGFLNKSQDENDG